MRVLLAIDDSSCSEAATRAVLKQFKPKDTQVKVLQVLEWPKGLPISLAFAEGPAAADNVLGIHQELRLRGQALSESAAERLRACGFDATADFREGDARHAILDCAGQWQPDVIVLGSHGRKGFDRLLLSSVSESVVRHAPCSVEVVRE
jgi:nucleotide-binding universal stress UspA family protein